MCVCSTRSRTRPGMVEFLLEVKCETTTEVSHFTSNSWRALKLLYEAVQSRVCLFVLFVNISNKTAL